MKLLFDQLKDIRKEVDIPLLLMGYLNPVMQFGIEEFSQKCTETGIDGVILPDLPLQVYEEEYQSVFEKHDLHNIFLISPQTTLERIHKIDNVSRGFIYLVSSSSTTGVREKFSPEQLNYFEKIKSLKLKNPGVIGFGISNRSSFDTACKYAQGAIIGSAFVKMLGEKGGSEASIVEFVKELAG